MHRGTGPRHAAGHSCWSFSLVSSMVSMAFSRADFLLWTEHGRRETPSSMVTLEKPRLPLNRNTIPPSYGGVMLCLSRSWLLIKEEHLLEMVLVRCKISYFVSQYSFKHFYTWFHKWQLFQFIDYKPIEHSECMESESKDENKWLNSKNKE